MRLPITSRTRRGSEVRRWRRLSRRTSSRTSSGARRSIDSSIGFLPSSVPAGIHRLATANSTFVPVVGATTTTAATYVGLPVIGFAVQDFNNGLLTVGGRTIGQNYGGNFVHKYTRLVQ